MKKNAVAHQKQSPNMSAVPPGSSSQLDKKRKTKIIVGCTVAGVVAIALIVVAVWGAEDGKKKKEAADRQKAANAAFAAGMLARCKAAHSGHGSLHCNFSSAFLNEYKSGKIPTYASFGSFN